MPDMDPLPRALTVEEAARVLRVSPGVVYGMVRSGVLPHRRAGRRILISRQRLQEWLNCVNPSSSPPIDPTDAPSA